MDVISPDQSAFLSLRFILDNLLITQETMAWAESSSQPLIFLKLDFLKAYDMVDWQCMYKIMEKMGFPQAFIKMVSLLFEDASACIKVNGEPSLYFPIQRGVRQGCPLAPYLFLIVAEVLNVMVSQEMRAGRVQGISLPFEGHQQIIAQYADDTSFTLFGDEEKVTCLIYLLQMFCLATGLVLNWMKSSGYWNQRGVVARPPWTDMLGIISVDEEGVSKLLGAPFGLSLATKDVDSFLLDKLSKKLVHYNTTKLNPTGRSIVANSVLLSSTFFFLSIWGRSRKGVKKIKSVIMNYVAGGKLQRARIRVSWQQCCQTKGKGGVNLINSEDAVAALMTKWLTKALEPGDSNLHLFLRFRLSQYQPYTGGRWPQSMEYFTISKHQRKKGSIVWNQIALAWKTILPFVSFRRPTNWEELMSCSFWWLESNSATDSGLSAARAAVLHKKGLKRYRDIWRNERFMTPREAQENFGLLPTEFPVWSVLVARIYHTWDDLLKARSGKINCREWLAIFEDTDNLPLVVCRAEGGFQPSIGNSTLTIPHKIQLFTVKHVSKLLEEIPSDMPKFSITWDELGEDTVQVCRCIVCRVRILEVIKGPKKTTIWLYYGLTSKLEWNPGCMYWSDSKEFMKYSSKQGRELSQHQARILNVVERKWRGVLPDNYKLKWDNVWDTERTKKEAGLMWMIWHKAVAVNAWRGAIT